MSATSATAVNRCTPVLAEGVGGAVGRGGAVRVGGPSLSFTAGPVQGGLASRCGSGGRKIPVVSAGGANGSGGVATAAVGVGAAEGAGAAERVRSGAEVGIGIGTAAVGVGALHASIGAVATAVGGGALRLGSAKLELYPHQGAVGGGGGAGTRTGVYLAFSAAEDFFHIWPRVFSLSAL